MKMRPSVSAVVLALLVACGGADRDGEATLTIEPATSEHLIEHGIPAHQAFTATLVYPDGQTKDVTDDTAFVIDRALGTFTENDLAIGTPGRAAVYGTYLD